MPARESRTSKKSSTNEPTAHSKDLPPLSARHGSIFFKNQFRTKIPPATKENFPDGAGGKVAVITGSNTGLGLESAKQLLSLGLSGLIMGVRSTEKGELAAKELRARYPSSTIDVWALDMLSYDSIKAFADRCESELSQIDIVILNAGLGKFFFESCPTGHETTIQVNHLSTVYLAVLLVPILQKKPKSSQPPRLTLVNSLTAHLCAFENRSKRPLLESMKDPQNWPSGVAGASEIYAISKLLCQIFIVQLCDRVDSNDVLINMVDPGLTKGTGLNRDTRGMIQVAGNIFLGIAGRTAQEGASTYVDAVLKQGPVSHGGFLMNCEVTPLAKWYYQEGECFRKLVWDETLEQLSSTQIEAALASI